MGIIDIEWRIPWESGWDQEKRIRAAEKLVDYMKRGTFFTVDSRARLIEANVVVPAPHIDPYITMKLER
jgi:hypothetical protein